MLLKRTALVIALALIGALVADESRIRRHTLEDTWGGGLSLTNRKQLTGAEISKAIEAIESRLNDRSRPR